MVLVGLGRGEAERGGKEMEMNDEEREEEVGKVELV